MIQEEGERDDNGGGTGTSRKEAPEKANCDARQRTTEEGFIFDWRDILYPSLLIGREER